ncbi:MAG: cell division protein ZipA [Xanthomonadales bacterium]|nr:cell division protein ZipA [Xanthomonadales bacterium]MBK7145524.1 cell division protein ZipA [Xanthomonadales bacterium]
MDANTLRIILAIVGALILGLIYWNGRRSAPPQGRRMPAKQGGERAEPQIGDLRAVARPDLDPELAAELARLGREIQGEGAESEVARGAAPMRDEPEPQQAELQIDVPPSVSPAVPPVLAHVESNDGARSLDKSDRIVTVYVAAPEGHAFAGSDIIVAAEKTGLRYGHLGIFHRMPATTSEYGAVFSVANMVRPGRFDMAQIQSLRTPGLSLFMVLPNAQSALDAWDAMLPTAQRLAELLGGQVLDEERNALGRQRIQHLRDELRAYDRAQEKNTIRKTW